MSDLVKTDSHAALQTHILKTLKLTELDAQYIVTMCQELEIPPMLGIHGVYAVKNKPFLSAALKRAVILKAGHTFIPTTLTPDECVIKAGRKGSADTFEFRFSRQYAEKTGRAKPNSAWYSDPMSMCLNACTHLVARAIFSDLFFGLTDEPLDFTPPKVQSEQSLSLSELNDENNANAESRDGALSESASALSF